jgi:hypothetical protein
MTNRKHNQKKLLIQAFQKTWGVDRIDLSLGRDKWWAVVTAIMNLQLFYKDCSLEFVNLTKKLC